MNREEGMTTERQEFRLLAYTLGYSEEELLVRNMSRASRAKSRGMTAE
jgi:hypothetical protein